MRLHLDIETFSTCDLKKSGLYKYAADPTTELLVVCYAFDDGPVSVWFPYAVPESVSRPLVAAKHTVWARPRAPDDLLAALHDGAEVAAHNAQFERVILNTLGEFRHGLPEIKARQMICTAAKAAAHGLPRNLEDAASVLGTYPKMSAGRNNMLALSKPRRGKDSRWTVENAPERFLELARYCIDDVEAERGIDRRLRDLPANEQRVWWLDQAINDRGVQVDLATIAHAEALIEEYQCQLEARCREITGFKPTQTDKLAAWVRSHGYPQLVDFQAASVELALKDPACPENIRTVLKLRSTYAMKAVSKYATMRRAAGADARLRGMLLYHGAGTGRWSSQIVQLQNLFRPVIKDPNTAIEAFQLGDLEWIRSLYPVDPMKVFASSIRGMLVPAPGKDFLALDFAGIESRFNAWLFDEEWKLKVFRDYDAGTGPDSYKVSYARSFSVPVDSVTDTQRQVGKVQELALGYEGGVNAYVTMVGTYRIDLAAMTEAVYPTLPEQALYEAHKAWEWAVSNRRTLDLPQKIYVTCDALKRLWRANHPHIVDGWRQLKDAAIAATEQPGKAFGLANRKVLFKKLDDWLFARLPSGRMLAYYKPEVQADSSGRKALTYMGVDTETRRWQRVAAYGGRWCENFCQGGSRDLMVNGMFQMERGGYPVVLTVHDELVTEIDEGFGSLEEARALMCVLPDWAKGLPLAAAGWRGKRYRK